MTEANFTKVVSTQASTSQADGSDSDSSVFSFSVTTPIVSYLDKTEWILDTGATYHVCLNRAWFSSLEKLDGYFTVMGDDHPCNVKGMGTVRISVFDGIVRELKEVRYVPQLKRNLISVGALEALDLMVSIRDGILKMTKGSMVVMKSVRQRNLYCLKGSTVTGQVETSISSDDDCIKLWQMKVGHGGETSLQTPVKKGSLEGAATCNLVGEHNALDKKVKFSTSTHRSEGLLDCVFVSVWGPAKTSSLGSPKYFVSFIDNLSRHCWIYPMR